MNEFAIELENGRQIEYALIDDVWQKVVCPHFKETMIKNSEKEQIANAMGHSVAMQAEYERFNIDEGLN